MLAEFHDTMILESMPGQASGGRFDTLASRQLWDEIRAVVAEKFITIPSMPGLNLANQSLPGGFAISPKNMPMVGLCGHKIGRGGGERAAVVPGNLMLGCECSSCHSRAKWQKKMPPFEIAGVAGSLAYTLAYKKHIANQAECVLVGHNPDICVDCKTPREDCDMFFW